MEISGQNLANVNTPGYSRQTLTTQAATPLQTPIGQEGTGVEATGIAQAVDSLLNSQIQAENSVSGSVNAQQQALQNVETYLNEQLTNTTNGTASPSWPDGGHRQPLRFFFKVCPPIRLIFPNANRSSQAPNNWPRNSIRSPHNLETSTLS